LPSSSSWLLRRREQWTSPDPSCGNRPDFFDFFTLPKSVRRVLYNRNDVAETTLVRLLFRYFSPFWSFLALYTDTYGRPSSPSARLTDYRTTTPQVAFSRGQDHIRPIQEYDAPIIAERGISVAVRDVRRARGVRRTRRVQHQILRPVPRMGRPAHRGTVRVVSEGDREPTPRCQA
jgi:hypothetical protein